MADYYDRLEAQLSELTVRGAHQRGPVARLAPHGFRWRPAPVRIRAGGAVAALAVLVVVAVSAVFLALGTGRQAHLSHHPASPGASGAVAIHNYWPGPVPPPAGPLVCNTTLTAQPGAGKSSGTAWVYNAPPSSFELRLSASGLTPNPAGKAYAVWIVQNKYAPHSVWLVGIVKPPVGGDGRLAVEGLIPPAVVGNEVLITVQSSASVTHPGRAVLEGPIGY
jgi:hypothetical protein